MKSNAFRAIAIVAVLLVSGTAESQNTFAHRWNIGESIGFGARNQPAPMAMDMKLDFSRRVGETPWRWGVAVGILSPGPVDYEVDESQDEFLFTGNIYLMGYADYAFCTVGKDKNVAFYLHGGLAPSFQRNKWTLHNDDKFSVITELGVGMDAGGYVRMAMNGFATIYGDVGVLFSIGFYFGRK
jgi:hypothetical protein